MEVARRTVRASASAQLHSDNPDVEELSRQLNDLKRSLPAFVTQGTEVEFSVVGPSSQTIKHGLGRLPQGFLVTYINFPGAAGTWCGNGWTAQDFYFYCSVNATVKIWIF